MLTHSAVWPEARIALDGAQPRAVTRTRTGIDALNAPCEPAGGGGAGRLECPELPHPASIPTSASEAMRLARWLTDDMVALVSSSVQRQVSEQLSARGVWLRLLAAVLALACGVTAVVIAIVFVKDVLA